MGLQKFESNQENIKNIITTFPGLRFYELRKETRIANGTLQHHISSLEKSNVIIVDYDHSIPRYYAKDVEADSRIIIKRLKQTTPSKIIKLLLNKECQIFSKIVKYTKKSPGTVSLYKNMLLKDGIIKGDTTRCSSCRNSDNKIKYRLVNTEKVRLIVTAYGKTSLQKSADNLADIFISLK